MTHDEADAALRSHRWDPARYLTFADERGRPFGDLLARVAAGDPTLVVDLGCGPGNLTELLTRRWPRARVLGVDSSPEMIARARADHPGPAYSVEDLRDWAPPVPGEVDVLISHATLQWLPDHLDLLGRLVGHVRPGGWFAFQVPGNFAEPSHTIRAELAAQPRYAEHLAGVAVPSSHDAATYLAALVALGCEVDAWETTYLHQLRGPDPVFTWVSGTGARPTLQALPEPLRAQFAADYQERLASAYPVDPHSGAVTLPFRRIFVVARVPDRAA